MNRRKSTRRKMRATPRFFLILLFLALAVTAIIILAGKCSTQLEPPNPSQTPGGITIGGTPDQTSTSEPEPTPSPTPAYTPIPNPTSIDSTKPSAFGLQTGMQLNGESITEYVSPYDILFGGAREYSAVEGVTTFRGNNFRDDATYGTATNVIDKKLELIWTTDIPGSIAKGTGSGTWFGAGWTGQPLIVRWPESTRSVMNIFDEKKAKDGLVEVIYATENSYIYFLDIDDGSFTRNHIKGGWTFKGSGSVDPRGYPLLYVGAGDSGPSGPAENMIFSLINGEKLFSYGGSDSFSLRSFKAFDGATIVHGPTDTVTYASECGVIYQFKLNTKYDESAGTISIDPSNMLKWRYTTERTRSHGTSSYWLGFEASPIIWRNYMYVPDNAGNLFCIDILKMEVIWMQDVLDDTNCTPIFDINESTGEAAIYLGTSTHWTADQNEIAQIPFWKINAITGEIIWKAPGYRCTRTNVSGGVQSTAALGKNNVSDLIFVSYALTVDTDTRGRLVAYSKDTGEEVWTYDLKNYSYSSPILMYDENGDGYLVTFDAGGTMYLLDARTGVLLDSLQLEGNFEASPAAFGNTIVIGTRASKIYGIKLK